MLKTKKKGGGKMKRTKIGQKKHDEGVLRSANYYEKLGFKVAVDLPGHKKPKEISGFIPDIIAKKGGEEIIIEVETRKTIISDKEQQEKFKKYAGRSNNRKFRTKIV